MAENQIQKGLTGASLKWMAIVLMAIDHVGAVIVEPMLIHPTLYQIRDWDMLYNFYMVLRALGRFSFPMFCFLMVEGFHYTRSKIKYVRNLAVFAIISEIPFDLALNGMIWSNAYQNVFFTLGLGLLAIWGAEELEKRYVIQNLGTRNEMLFRFLYVAIAAIVAIVAELFNTDYGAIGVIVIFILYLRRTQKVTGAFIAWIILSLNNWLEIFCLPFVGAVKLYNGQRGKQNKYFFYLFYPVHLLVLYIIRAIYF